jgi:hypothetical protein
MLSSGYETNRYAGIYADMAVASQIYARDGVSKKTNDIMTTVFKALISALVKVDVGLLLNAIAN